VGIADLNFNEIALNEQQLKPILEFFKANLVRVRNPFTVIFFGPYDENHFKTVEQMYGEKKLEKYLQSKIRKEDLLFKLSKYFGWGVILSQSSEKEATAFIQRVFDDINTSGATLFPSYELELVSSVIEIGNDEAELEELVANGKQALNNAKKIGPGHIEYVVKHKERKVEEVKVSILDPDELFQDILKMALERIALSHFQLDIKVFQDGYEFLESKWFLSSHRHIIIMNDILPRKNGFEVLKILRSLPGDKRFVIYMMTKRKAEGDMTIAYENGVDGYLTKPFNIKLLEAQLKRTMERM
jgi:CheY-like chemotaxis protein